MEYRNFPFHLIQSSRQDLVLRSASDADKDDCPLEYPESQVMPVQDQELSSNVFLSRLKFEHQDLFSFGCSG